MTGPDTLQALPGADRALLVGPDPARADARRILAETGYRLRECDDLDAARRLLAGGEEVHLLLVDLGTVGADALAGLRADFPGLPVVAMRRPV